MTTEVIITPDMTPDEIAALQNPGYEDPNEGNATDSAPAPAPAPAAPASAPDNAQLSMEGRVNAATRSADDATRRAELLEQNNEFLSRKAAEAAADAAKLREQAATAEAARKTLEDKMARASAPTLGQEQIARLVDEHGEHGAKPFIEMRNSMLAMEHTHKLELDSLKEATTSMPKQIQAALGQQQANAASSAFNAALMDATIGIPNLGVLLKDPMFVSKMQADPWGAMNPFNAALASNDKSSIPTIKAIVERITGVKTPMGADPGNGGQRSTMSNGGGGDATDRDTLVNQWNGMLDRGEFAQAQAFSSKHKLME